MAIAQIVAKQNRSKVVTYDGIDPATGKDDDDGNLHAHRDSGWVDLWTTPELLPASALAAKQ